jgi:hypothetical protein
MVPRGGVFEWVSCPHYLGEIVIYVGLAVVLKGRGLSLVILAWVVRTLHLCTVIGGIQMFMFVGYPIRKLDPTN